MAVFLLSRKFLSDSIDWLLKGTHIRQNDVQNAIATIHGHMEFFSLGPAYEWYLLIDCLLARIEHDTQDDNRYAYAFNCVDRTLEKTTSQF